MTWIDYLLLLALAYFIFKGARRGFVATIGAFIGILLGAWAAGQYYDGVAQWLIEFWDFSIMSAIVIAFVGIYIAVNIAAGLIVRFATLVLHILPLGKTMNRIVGAFLGLAEGLLLIGLIIWVITLFPFDNAFTATLKGSRVANYFEYSTRIVRPLLPASLREVDFSFLKDLENLTDEKAEYLQQYMPEFIERIKDRREQLKQQAQDLKDIAEEKGVEEEPQ